MKLSKLILLSVRPGLLAGLVTAQEAVTPEIIVIGSKIPTAEEAGPKPARTIEREDFFS